MSKEKEREAWTKVIKLFKELTHLHEKKHKDYLSRDKRKKGYKMLLDVYSAESDDKNITMADFKKKLDNMRTSYGRELKRVIASKRTGSGSSDVYTPSLWYYSLLDFLEYGTTESCYTTIDTLDEMEESKPEVIMRSRNVQPPVSPGSPAETSNARKQRMILLKKQGRMFGTEQMMARKEEEWEITGKSLGLQMRDLDKPQLVYVQKIMSDAIYFGKMGKLTEESHITLN